MPWNMKVKSRLILESGSVGIASDAERAERRKADEDLAVRIEDHDGAWFATRWQRLLFLKVKNNFQTA